MCGVFKIFKINQKFQVHFLPFVKLSDWGRVDFGYVSSPRLLKKDVKYPYGMRTNTDFILSQLARYMKSAEVIAVDFGDFYRLNAVVSECVPDAADKLRQKIAKDFDLFLGELCRLVTDDDTIIILSPIVQSQALGDEKLSFAAIRGKDFEKGSLLFSPSTRRSGVITMSDIAPTILSRFGIAPVDDISGRELSSVKCTDHRKTVLEINEKAKTHAENIVIMRFTSVAQTIIIIVAFLILLLWRKYVEAAKNITLIPAIIPLVMLWMSPLPNMGVVLSSICLILSTLALFFVCVYAIRNVFKSFFVVALAILATIALDMIFFKTLMASSIGGYTIVGGARYYGMGNEFMGTTLGACLFVMGYMLYCEKMEKYAKLAVCAIAAALFAVVGLSSLGANVGGAIASAMASVTLILLLCGVRINLKSIVYICLITVVFLGFIFALDAMKDSSMQSHAGKIVSLASKGKANDIVQVFERKLLTNLRLFTVSLWSRLFVVALVCGCLLAFFSRPHTREEKAVLAGMISGVCAAFVFNDSGVVAGATCGVWLFAFAMCLYAKKAPP